MLSEKLAPGMRVLHDNTGKAKTIYDTINMLDDYAWLILFTDGTYTIVPEEFKWDNLV